MSVMLNLLSLREITQKLEPYKRTPSDTPLTTLTQIIDCSDRSSKFLQNLDLDSQRISQSSHAIQAALESMNTFFF